jgi:hypothetical protein
MSLDLLKVVLSDMHLVERAIRSELLVEAKDGWCSALVELDLPLQLPIVHGMDLFDKLDGCIIDHFHELSVVALHPKGHQNRGLTMFLLVIPVKGKQIIETSWHLVSCKLE